MIFHVFAHFIDKNNGFQVFDALKNPTGVKYAPSRRVNKVVRSVSPRKSRFQITLGLLLKFGNNRISLSRPNFLQ